MMESPEGKRVAGSGANPLLFARTFGKSFSGYADEFFRALASGLRRRRRDHLRIFRADGLRHRAQEETYPACWRFCSR